MILETVLVGGAVLSLTVLLMKSIPVNHRWEQTRWVVAVFLAGGIGLQLFNNVLNGDPWGIFPGLGLPELASMAMSMATLGSYLVAGYALWVWLNTPPSVEEHPS